MLESDSMLLPHERVGSDFSWLNDKSEEDLSALKANELEDEESFLYGTEASSQNTGHDTGEKISSSSMGAHQSKSLFSNLVDPKTPQQMALSAISSVSLNSTECEKIKSILNNMGGTSDTGRMLKTPGQKEENYATAELFNSDAATATLSDPSVRKALESLQTLIKGQRLLFNPSSFQALISFSEFCLAVG